jgi:hypothetical protein
MFPNSTETLDTEQKRSAQFSGLICIERENLDDFVKVKEKYVIICETSALYFSTMVTIIT